MPKWSWESMKVSMMKNFLFWDNYLVIYRKFRCLEEGRQIPATTAQTCSKKTMCFVYMKLEGANANPLSHQNSSMLLLKVHQ